MLLRRRKLRTRLDVALRVVVVVKPVSGSMPRTAPIISLANRMFDTGITFVSRSMPGW
jgi:hypothetical protein